MSDWKRVARTTAASRPGHQTARRYFGPSICGARRCRIAPTLHMPLALQETLLYLAVIAAILDVYIGSELVLTVSSPAYIMLCLDSVLNKDF